MRARILKPSILVSLKTQVKGGVSYNRVDLEQGPSLSRWETTKEVDDPEEKERADKVRNNARAMIASICSNTSFGLICPINREADLDFAHAAAKDMISEFNATANHSQVSVFVMKGRIATNDEEAMRGLNSEMADLVQAMNSGIENLDPKKIREAAIKAKAMLGVLEDGQAQIARDAIETARGAAREIVRRVQKAGESSEVVLNDLKLQSMDQARIAFMDFEPAATSGEALPAVNMQRFADLDIDNDVANLSFEGVEIGTEPTPEIE